MAITDFGAALEGERDCSAIRLDKEFGQTVFDDAALSKPRWSWPPR